MRKDIRLLVGFTAMLALLTFLLSGCSGKEKKEGLQATTTDVTTIDLNSSTILQTVRPTSTALQTVVPTLLISTTTAPVTNLSSTQRNSINMLNWLAFLTQEINAENNNRLFIEDVYSLIVNETYPNAVDVHTQDRLKGIRQALVRYRMVDVKRERIEFLFEQNKAQTIKAAIPNPLTLMNVVQSESLTKLAVSVVYMAINSISSYQSATTQAELQYLQDGWELDDEASEVFYNLRSDAFDYMIDIVREYDLPGYLALNEKAIEEFVSWKGKDDVNRRILFLENNVETYQAFGSYWLLLAESYYSIGNYAQCLDAIHSYETLSTRIFRKDYEYAKILPLAVIASEYVLTENEFVAIAEQYAKKILDNIDTEDWDLRYFATQIYVNLYAKTQNTTYLWDAYSVVLSNVNYLVDEQLTMNTTYTAKVQEEAIPAGTTKDKETQIKKYNQLVKEKRKTELPPVSEPLMLNCDLLFSIATQLNIQGNEKKRIDNILHENGDKLFLVDDLDNKYRYTGKNVIDASTWNSVSFNGKELTIPASCLTENASISVKVIAPEGQETVFEDWKISVVNWQTEDDITTYAGVFKSATAEKYSYKVGTTVNVSVVPHKEYETAPICFNFEAIDNKPNWYNHIAIWSSDIAFKRVN